MPRPTTTLFVALSPLLLWGCPPGPIGFRALVSSPTPTFVVMQTEGFSAALRPLIHRRYRIRSGETIVWQIDRVETCGEPYGPEAVELRYGEQPTCFATVVPAQPLIDGQAYVLEGWQQTSEFAAFGPYDSITTFTWGAGRIVLINWDRYAELTGDSSLLPPQR